MTVSAVESDERTRAEGSSGHSSVTVVVPVRNEAAFIARTLDQLLSQDCTGIDVEIVVVDGQSTDNTAEIVSQYSGRHPQVRLLSNPRRLSSTARNLAIHSTQGEYIVVIDGHCEIPTRRYFHEIVDAFETSGADCLGRPQPLDVSEATTLQLAIALARSSRLGHHPESFIYSDQPQFVPAKSVAVAYRRDVFDRIGCFDERFDAHEDGEFNYRCDRAGLRCFLTPRITVKYFPRSSLTRLFRQMVRYGRGRVRFSRKHPGTWGLGVVAPTLLVLFLAIGGALAAWFPAWRSIFAVVLLGYVGGVIVESLRIARRSRSLRPLFYIPLVFATVHLGAGVGVLAELLLPVQWLADRGHVSRGIGQHVITDEG